MKTTCGILTLLSAITALAADWPRLLGPADNMTTPESGLLRDFPKDGLPVLWEMPKGEGMGGPAIVGSRVVVFHRVGDDETVECRDAATGAQLWKHAYPAPYQPRYGGGLGPRTSPVIADGRVFTFGIGGMLTALSLADGKVLWQRDAAKDFEMQEVFFGHGSTPLAVAQRLVVQLGGKENGLPLQTAALDVATGRKLWTTTHEWGASYASPVPARLHGRDCVLVFAGGEERPPVGGLLVLDLENGRVLASAPHRATIAESVNASSPVLIPADPPRVLISEAYTEGARCVEIAADFSTKAAWHTPDFGTYWMTPLIRDGIIFGVTGMAERTAQFGALDAATGRELWRDDLGGGFGRASLVETGDGILCLGEFGDLAWLDLSRTGGKVHARTKLFHAPETWTPPALSEGRLFIQQNEPAAKRRLICYLFRQ